MKKLIIWLKKPTLLLIIAFLIAIVIFLKNAWVSEDAYITFRSVEQIFAGNGPVWNPHERVQVYTSPLWFLLLILFRVFSANVYLNAIVLSLILWTATIFILRKIFSDPFLLLFSVLLLTASTSFFDYTSPGLENILAYLIIALYILNYLKLFEIGEEKEQTERTKSYIKKTLFFFGIIIFVRHDLALLLLPPTIYIPFRKASVFSRKQWLISSSLSLLPIILFSLFSLIYYGFPFPNTAYAKLSTGIDKTILFNQGINYFHSTFKYDIITILIILIALISAFFRRSEKHLKYLGFGIILNLLYVCYIGGDFMQGRFLSYAYLISVILFFLAIQKINIRKITILVFVILEFYLILYPHTPFNSPVDYRNSKTDMGVADERGFYFNALSLHSYIFRDKYLPFPDNAWTHEGIAFKNSSQTIFLHGNIGILGYYAGTEKIIIDGLALSDPFLARLPADPGWRIGHFGREIPYGYLESIGNDNKTIGSLQLYEFHKKLVIITQSDKLFTQERLKTIFLFNIGAYNHLLPTH